MQNLLVLTDSTRVLCPGYFAKMQDSCALREVKKKKENISSINMGSQSSMNKYPGRHGQYEMSSRGKDAFLIEKNNNCVDVSVYMYRKYSSKKKNVIFQRTTLRTYSLLRDLLLRSGLHGSMLCFCSLPITNFLKCTLYLKQTKKKTLREGHFCLCNASLFHALLFQKKCFSLQ